MDAPVSGCINCLASLWLGLFEDKLILKEMLTSGEVSINKLSRVASVATPENEEELAAKIKVLPKNALEVWVRDVKL